MEKTREVKLTSELVQNFGVARIFRDNTAAINSLDFNSTGDRLVTSSLDESLHVYDVDNGELSKTVFVKRYGVNIVRFTHHPNAVIAASNNDSWDDAIRYLSLHDNRYLRYFKAHRDKVVTMEMSPVDDTFLSGSLDNTIRLWDLRTNACQGYIKISGRPAVSYDPQGLVFAVAAGDNGVKLYDVRSYDQGPFSDWHVEGPAKTWTSLSFSPDGSDVLLSTDSKDVVVLDAFDGALKHTLSNRINEHKTNLEACFSPDAKYILSGSEDGSMHVWNSSTGAQVAQWSGDSQPTTAVRWCPRRMMVASASSKLALWLPDFSRLQDQQREHSLRYSMS